MIEVLRIRDTRVVSGPGGRTGRVLAFDLRDFLPLVAQEGPRLRWAAIPMEAEETYVLGNEGPREDEPYVLGKRVDASTEGVPLGYDDLVDLSNVIRQTVWGTFVAVRDPAAFAEIPSLFHGAWRYVDRASARFYELVEIAFQAVDGGFWLVWARDEAVRERIREAFLRVESIPGMSFYEPREERAEEGDH